MTERQEKPRWQQLFQSAAESLFLLDGERRVLFVNLPFSQQTGISLAQLRGRVCRPYAAAPSGSEEALLALLAPPLEVLEGKPASVRRPVLQAAHRVCDIHFFPLGQKDDLLAILGKLGPPAERPAEAEAPLPARLLALRERGRQWHRLDHLRSEVPALRRVLEQVRLAVRTLEPVWISGEAGVGKQWLARTIHHEGETRDRGFAALDCRRLPPAVILREMLGGRPTAGTIYLQQPQFLPGEAQAQIAAWFRQCRADSGQSKCTPRVLVGSSQPPELVGATLVEDFGFTFSALSIALPPLRERRADFAMLAQRLLERAASAAGKPIKGIAAEAFDLLQAASWPGNLRELYTVLHHACWRAREAVIAADDLPWYLRGGPAAPERTLSLDAVLEQAERRLILLALERSREKRAGAMVVNQSRAADLLSIWRARLARRLKELGIEGDAAGTGSDL